jgi:hypothetical protein
MKSVDINQRIPLDTLETALISYLNGDYDEGYVLEQLRLDYSGENRLKKSLRIVNKLVPKSPISEFLMKNSDKLLVALKQKPDRDVILIALLNASFNFSFDTFEFLTRIFNAQPLVNSDTVIKALSKIYGGNRSTVNAVYSVIPMFLEAGLLVRPKTGVYESNGPIIVTNEVSRLIYQKSFSHNKGMQLDANSMITSPYLEFIQL